MKTPKTPDSNPPGSADYFEIENEMVNKSQAEVDISYSGAWGRLPTNQHCQGNPRPS